MFTHMEYDSLSVLTVAVLDVGVGGCGPFKNMDVICVGLSHLEVDTYTHVCLDILICLLLDWTDHHIITH